MLYRAGIDDEDTSGLRHEQHCSKQAKAEGAA